MLRRLIGIIWLAVTALGSILCVVLWIRSHYLIDAVVIRTPIGSVDVDCMRGQGLVRYYPRGREFSFGHSLHRIVPEAHYDEPLFVDWVDSRWHRFGVGIRPVYVGTGKESPAVVPAGYNYFSVIFPMWAALALTVPPWAIVLCRKLWHKRAIVDGMCVNCGYDLRATPDRCPECGQEIIRQKMVTRVRLRRYNLRR